MTTPETTTALIEEALTAGAATADRPDERAIQELALAVRADAPVADPEFERRLAARVAAGFPSERRFRGLGGLDLRAVGRPRLAALGVAASVLAALVVSVSLLGGGAGSPSPFVDLESGDGGAAGGGPPARSAPAVVDEVRAPQARRGPEAARGPAQADRPAPGGSAPLVAPGSVTPPVDGLRRRRVRRGAALTLAAPGDRLQEVADGVVAVTDRHRGFVLHSSVTAAADDGTAGGSFDLRIPARNLRPALRDLSQLGEVRARTETADDVTRSFGSARARIQELRARRRGLLRRLARAATDREERGLRAQLRFVNAEIAAATGRLGQLRRRTVYAAVSVALVADADAEAGGDGLAGGWRDFEDAVVDSVNAGLRVLGFALPAALVVAVAWIAARGARRRRREAVLDRLGRSGAGEP